MQKLFYLLLFTPFLAFSQPKTTLIPGFKFTGGANFGLARDAGTGTIFMLARSAIYGENERSKWSIHVLTADFKQLHASIPNALDVPDGTRANNGRLVSLKGNTGALFLVYKNRKSTVYLAPVSAGEGLGTPKQVALFEGNYILSSQIKTAYSADSSLFLLAQFPVTNELKQPYSYLILDAQHNVLRTGELAIPEDASPRLVGTPILANDGSIWAPVWTKNKEFRQEIWVWKQSGALPQVIDMSLSAEYIGTDMRLAQSPFDGHIYAGGVFADASGNAGESIFRKFAIMQTAAPDPQQGTFMNRLDEKDGNLLSSSVHEFSAETLRFWQENTTQLKKEIGVDWLRMSKVVPLADGNAWVCSEPVFILNKGKTIMNSIYFGYEAESSVINDFRGGSAILTCHTLSGEVKKESVIPANRQTNQYMLQGYNIMANSRGDLLAYYNDHVENIGKNIKTVAGLQQAYDAPLAGRKGKACGALYTTSWNGTSSVVCGIDEWIQPSNGIMTGPGVAVFVYPVKGSQYAFLKVEW